MSEYTQISNSTLLIVAEAGAILVVVLIITFMSQNKTQKKLKEVKEQNKKFKHALADAKNALLTFFKVEISETRKRHKTQNKTKDMQLSLDTNLSTQTTALRHAYLSAEKKAFSRAKKNKQKQWNMLDQNLHDILATLTAGTQNSTELKQKNDLLTSQKNNLQQYKELFFDLQKKGQEAVSASEKIQSNIFSLISENEENEELTDLLKDYQSAFNDLFKSIEHSEQSGEDEEGNYQLGDEIREQFSKLKTIAKKQKDRISSLKSNIKSLKQRLKELEEDANATPEALNYLREEMRLLGEELEHMELMHRDAEMCVQILESDNDSLQEKLHTSETQTTQLENKTNQQQRKLTELEKEITELKSKIENMQEIEDVDEGPLSLDLGEVKVEELQITIQQKDDEITALTEQLAEFQANLNQSAEIEQDEDFLEDEGEAK
jgi:chromosome segregation ATPase